MPNIQTQKLELANFPAKKDGYLFEYIATQKDGRESLISVKFEDKRFFLVLIKRENDYLIKADKLSKISPIFIIKDALKAFCDLHSLDLTFSNIGGKKSPILTNKNDHILKDIEFFANEFKSSKEIWVEIGFGSGRHLLHQAKENPNIQFIGLEIHTPSIEQVIKQCKLQEIDNILICKFDARVFLELLPSNSVGKIFIHFPVPWDKKPHRRVINQTFIEESIRVLKKDGTLELRTDSQNYYEYSYNLFSSLNKVEFIIRKNIDLPISSKYEDRWKKMEKNIYDLILVNQITSEKKEFKSSMNFSKNIDISKLKNGFENLVIKGDDFFIHFEKLYQCSGNCAVLKLSFGAFERCEHKYLIFNNNKIQYFPNDSLPTKQSLKSHQIIEEFLYDRYNSS